MQFKKQMFKQLRTLHSRRKSTLRTHALRFWKHRTDAKKLRLTTSERATSLLQSVAAAVKELDHEEAWYTWWHQHFANLTRKAVRYDNAQYLQTLTHQAADCLHRGGMTSLWKSLRAFLPKHAKRRGSQLYGIEQDLIAHFAELEAGTSIAVSAHEQACRARNLAEWHSAPAVQDLALEELPTLHEVETLCRKQKTHKAPGPDQLVPDLFRASAVRLAVPLHCITLKAFLCGSEPVLYKGGTMTSIFKGKGSCADATGYRGILLSPVCAKILHGWCRARAVPALQHHMVPGQMGGFVAQQPATAHHILRLRSVMAKHLSLSTGVLFVDVKSAFHHMLREFVFTNTIDMERHILESCFDSDQHDLDRLQETLEQAAAIHPLKAFHLGSLVSYMTCTKTPGFG